MTFSHTSCSHPATSKDRAKCRKLAESGNSSPKPATSRATRNANRTATEAQAGADATEIIDKAKRIAKSNAARTANAQMRNPLKERGECFVCGSRAAHFVRSTKQPVCMKHIDNWDNIGIIPV